MIPNHASAKLSDLDLRMAAAVPPGGNWRDIPDTIPSARLAQIRVSAAAGEGSRSTYYGRLHPDRPAYTVNTYYNRLGNGCVLHYDYEGGQHRTLSHREAARLQSFPDSYEFGGSQRAVCQQIGNAVPPLLAFQIAQSLGEPGTMVDVFAGAGGLSLGFQWAGWESLAAVDSDRHAIDTFNANIHDVGFVGDMNDPAVHARLLDSVGSRKNGRLALVGGPPCQGFSTGGKKRSTDDIRNSLHSRYAELLAKLRPDVFVFENVLGLLSMDGGRFVARVLEGLRGAGYDVALWRMNAARQGVPQRRERVVIVGVPHGGVLPRQPRPWTSPVAGLLDLPLVTTVSQALGDLPPLVPGQDGSTLPYLGPAGTHYQGLMRGLHAPSAFCFGNAADDSYSRPGVLRSLPEVA